MALFHPNFKYDIVATSNPNEFKTLSSGAQAFEGQSNDDNTSTTFSPGDYLSSIDEGWGYYVGYYEKGFVTTWSDSGTHTLYTNNYYSAGTTFTVNTGSFVTCFLARTLISCPGGQRAVEELAAGDLVLTASGETREVRWIGRQTVVSVFADEVRAFPIRISAGALADDLPRRDLFVSPGHALLIDGLLVHAGALVNGSTISRVTDPGPSFEYFHIETEDHAVILAEGVPAETFLDNVPRSRFDNHAEYEARFGSSPPPMQELCMPRVKSARQLPPAIRERLEARADLLAPKLGAAA